jgi:hypothetical protein
MLQDRLICSRVLTGGVVGPGCLGRTDDHGGRDESPGDYEGDLGVGAGIDHVEVARGVGAHVSDLGGRDRPFPAVSATAGSSRCRTASGMPRSAAGAHRRWRGMRMPPGITAVAPLTGGVDVGELGDCAQQRHGRARIPRCGRREKGLGALAGRQQGRYDQHPQDVSVRGGEGDQVRVVAGKAPDLHVATRHGDSSGSRLPIRWRVQAPDHPPEA